MYIFKGIYNIYNIIYIHYIYYIHYIHYSYIYYIQDIYIYIISLFILYIIQYIYILYIQIYFIFTAPDRIMEKIKRFNLQAPPVYDRKVTNLFFSIIIISMHIFCSIILSVTVCPSIRNLNAF